MRKTLTFIIIAFSSIIYSCENGKIRELETSISELTELNSRLTDSIQTLQEKTVSSFYLKENIEKINFKVDKTNIIHFEIRI